MENGILLLEATFSHADFDKATNLLAKVISRGVSAPLYRMGGSHGIQRFRKSKSGDGIGAVFFIGNTPAAIRLNYEAAGSKSIKVTSIDYWKEFHLETKPDKNVKIPEEYGSPLVAVAAIDFIKSHGQSIVNVNESIFSEGVYEPESVLYKEQSSQ